jgi:3-deoxy-D-manno-octulosonate 8-phosphate phosphatase (KDO 8-P phosphatase)
MIELVILDIDGVMTDGTKVYDRDGKVIAKRFNDKDFTAIKQLKAAGVKVCFLSGDDNVNKKVAEDRNIDFFHSRDEKGNLNKAIFIQILSEKYNVNPDNMVYVGDDYFDLEIIKELDYTFCPADAVSEVQDEVYMLLGRRGGEGVIVSLVDTLKQLDLMGDYDYDKVKYIDILEKR